MSRVFYLAIAVALVSMASAPASAWAAGGYIFDAGGAVSITPDKKIAPRPAVKNDAVASGTVIRTGDNSHAVLKFEDGQVVSLQANTTFQVREYRYEPRKIEESNIVFSMFKGGMRFVTGQIGQRNKQAFRLATPNATIGIRGTEFMIVMANNATYCQVLSGSIGMTNAAGLSVISAGQTALTSSATTLTTAVPAASVPAGTFSQIAVIPVPAAIPAPVPPPASAALKAGTTIASGTTTTTAGTAAVTSSTTAVGATAGGATAGGAAASTAATAGGAATGVSATTIGIGAGVAAIAAAVISSSTTQH